VDLLDKGVKKSRRNPAISSKLPQKSRNFQQTAAEIPQFLQNKTLIINTNRKSTFYSRYSAKNVIALPKVSAASPL
jgi:hypothetical protein